LEELASLGVIDVAWIEMEHGPWTWRELSDASRVCDLWGITSLVRVNVNNAAVIGRTLDRGVQGIVVPHVNTSADAERVVQGALYSPKGMRGVGGFPRQSIAVPDYLKEANDDLMIVVLLEEVEAIHNLDAILSVDNIDCFYIGASDLAQSMGPQYLGRPEHPDVQAVVQQAIRQVVESGRTAGTTVNDGNVAQFLDMGCRFLRWNAMPYLYEGLQRFHATVAHAIELESQPGS